MTVKDVLEAIYDTFNVMIDPKKWARDSVNPKHAERVLRAYRRRVEKTGGSGVRADGYQNNTRKDVLRRVDYLGSKYCFSGIMLCFAEDQSEWWMMQVVPEER